MTHLLEEMLDCVYTNLPDFLFIGALLLFLMLI